MKRETPMKLCSLPSMTSTISTPRASMPPVPSMPWRRGFTLVEVLASCAVLAILLTVLLSMTAEVQKTSRLTQGKTEQFREARVAFETITRRLSQATLNTYWNYDSPTNPTKYIRQSELRFKCANFSIMLPPGAESTTHGICFQAPFGFTNDSSAYGGMESMVNTWGYYIEFGSDANLRPPVLGTVGVPERRRFRLFEMMEPAENLTIYKHTSGNPFYNGMDWFRTPLTQTNRSSRVLADNIVALIFLPKDPTDLALSSDYGYDSSPNSNASDETSKEHQLPAYIQVTMVAIDEQSAARLAANYGNNMPSMIKPQWFTDTSKYEEDLDWLRQQLSGKWDSKERVNYRIFNSNVALRGAKWSRN